jgi:hypothetical protein
MIESLRRVKRFLRKVGFIVTHLGDAWAMAYDPALNETYCPGEELKSKPRILLDLIWWLARFGEVNEYYYTYGFDRAHGARMNEYLDYQTFKRIRNMYNNSVTIGGREASYACLVKDKFVFQRVLKSLGFPTPAVIAFCLEGRIHWVDSRRITAIEALWDVPGLDAFCKPLLGECADGVFRLRRRDGSILSNGAEVSPEDLRRAFRAGYVLQEYVTQHPKLAAFHPGSVATLRLVTIGTPSGVELFESGLKLGTGRIVVSNFSAGGIIGEIDPATGRLFRSFYGKPRYGVRSLQRHPDSGLPFEGFEVPFYREAVEMAKELHRRLYGLASIGWDIAVGPDGPIIIEGNDNWELTQTPLTALRKPFLALLPDRASRRGPVEIVTCSGNV